MNWAMSFPRHRVGAAGRPAKWRGPYGVGKRKKNASRAPRMRERFGVGDSYKEKYIQWLPKYKIFVDSIEEICWEWQQQNKNGGFYDVIKMIYIVLYN